MMLCKHLTATLTPAQRRRERAQLARADRYTWLAAEHYRDAGQPWRGFKEWHLGQFREYVAQALAVVALERFLPAFELYGRESLKVADDR